MRVASLTAILVWFGVRCFAKEIDLSYGTLDLPDGFVEKPTKGIDSKVGTIVSEKEKLEIHYDIGRLAGLYADPKARKDRWVWFKEGKANDHTYYYAVSKRVAASFYVTFPDVGPTNFYADVKTEQEINRVLEIVTKFKPKPQQKPKEDPESKSKH